VPAETPISTTAFALLRALTALVERYAQRTRPWRLEAFLLWALGEPEARASSLAPRAEALPESALSFSSRPGKESLPREEEGRRADSAFTHVPGYGQMSVPSETGRLIGGLYKQMRHSVRQHMQGQPVSNLDDFGLLSSLVMQPGIKKTDLIARNHLELSSGSDSISRLVRAGLISEAVDPTDRRVRKLSLTDAGQAAIFEAFQKMSAMAEAMLAVLSPDEIDTLHHLLNKLYSSGPREGFDA